MARTKDGADPHAAPPDLRLVLPHVGAILLPPGRGTGRLMDHRIETEVRVRGVAPSSIAVRRCERVRAVDGKIHESQMDLHVWDGRLWARADGVASQMARLSGRVRRGEAPGRIRHGLFEGKAPFRFMAAPRLVRNQSPAPDPIPDRVRGKAVLDLEREALRCVHAFASRRMIHDGVDLFLATSPPVLVALGGVRSLLPSDLSAVGQVRQAFADYDLPCIRLTDVDSLADVLGFGKDTRDLMWRVATASLLPVADIVPDDADVEAFLASVPSEILDMARQGGAAGAEVREAVEPLWRWAAIAGIGALDAEGRAEALPAIRRASEIVADLHPTPRHRTRAKLILRYLDGVVRHRVEAARPPLPEDDALSLCELAPSR